MKYSQQIQRQTTEDRASQPLHSKAFQSSSFAVQQKSAPALMTKAQLWDNYHQAKQLTQRQGANTLMAPAQTPSLPIQAKLTIGQPGDKYEQEADSVADRVMAMSEPTQVQREELPEEELQMKPLAETISPLVQREELPEEEELQMKPEDNVVQREALPEEEELQMKSVDNSIQREELPEEEELQMKQSPTANTQTTSDLESQLGSSKGGGTPLSDDVRSFMEPRFGADFSGVRVHTGSDAVQMNRDVNAQAFAHGSDIYFGAGKAPGKDALTAHELTHVVQQSGNFNKLAQVQPGLDRSTPRKNIEGLSINKTSNREIVQCAGGKWKIEKHGINYEENVRNITEPLGDLDPVQKADEAEAIKLGKLLDDRNTTSSIYDIYHSTKKGRTHPYKRIHKDAKAYYDLLDKLEGEKRTSTQWHERNDGIKGRSMKASFIGGEKNLPKGSNTTDTVDGYFYDAENLKHRKNTSGSTLYIKGHLLNDNLGGSGRYFNLVPLTAEKNLKNITGSNDANAIHCRQVESIAKTLVGTPVVEKDFIKYHVESMPPKGATRPQTKVVEDFALAFETIANKNPTENTSYIRKEVEKVHSEFIGIAQQLITAVGKGSAILPSNLIPILKSNADLWKLEEARVPAGIKCSLSYQDMKTGTRETAKTPEGDDIKNFEIENVLPTLYTAPYKE
jgi:hypothetical protein